MKKNETKRERSERILELHSKIGTAVVFAIIFVLIILVFISSLEKKDHKSLAYRQAARSGQVSDGEVGDCNMCHLLSRKVFFNKVAPLALTKISVQEADSVNATTIAITYGFYTYTFTLREGEKISLGTRESISAECIEIKIPKK